MAKKKGKRKGTSTGNMFGTMEGTKTGKLGSVSAAMKRMTPKATNKVKVPL